MNRSPRPIQRFLLLLGCGLAVLASAPFLLHPPTGWMVWNVTVPSVIAAASVAIAVRAKRDAWCLPVIFVAVPWMFLQVSQALYHVRMLPPEIDATGVLSLRVDGFDRSGCGAAVFRLAPWTASVLLLAGPEGLGVARYRLAAWKKIQDSAQGGQPWRLRLGCDLGKAWRRDIETAVGSESGIYSEQRGYSVLVLPESRIAVLVYGRP